MIGVPAPSSAGFVVEVVDSLGASNANLDELAQYLSGWIARFEQVPKSVHKTHIPTRHDLLDDETGEPFLPQAYVAVQQGAPYAFFGRNVVVFNGRDMRAAEKIWKERIAPLLGLGKPAFGRRLSDLPDDERRRIRKEGHGPFSSFAPRLAVAIPLLKRVRADLLALKKSPLPVPRPRPRRWPIALVGVLLLAGGVAVIARSDR